MLRPVVTRNLMLDFIADKIICPEEININRVFQVNEKNIKSGEIVYIMNREYRIEDNWGFLFAFNLAKAHTKKFSVIIYLNQKNYSKHQFDFIIKWLKPLKENLSQNKINFIVYEGDLSVLCKKSAAVVFDFNPTDELDKKLKSLNCAVFEVDSHNIIPARFISAKQEFSAATLRRKVYGNIASFLTEYPSLYNLLKSEAKIMLEDFVKNKLDFYSEKKNDPNENCTSCLSPYLHFGLISAQRVALEVLKSNASRINKESFLEELIVRKELADNFCLYSSDYKSFADILDWAKETLENHRNDIRTYVYSLREFEIAQTHDELWNAIQLNLLKTGKIHGYLRMYWAKKILEWSSSPEEALKIAIYLNDEYALDGNDPNGYVGILWSLGGLHDRAFSQRPATGKIRYMSYQGCKNKFDVKKYIESI